MKSFLYNDISYFLLRGIMYPISFLSLKGVHKLGKFLGSIAYHLAPKNRKKITYNNLALAKTLELNERQIKQIAKESFQNLVINCLEYFKLKRMKHNLSDMVSPKNPKVFMEFVKKGQGVLCVTGHISNWELCFLEHSVNYPIYAIGKEIKNPRLYHYIQSVRTMHKGKIVGMKKAIKEAITLLKKGTTFSMVNDQAYTPSSYSYPFFGVRAWTSAAPAMIAYKANIPIFSITTKRLENGKYEYSFSEPFFPDPNKPLKQEVKRLMDLIMKDFERAIAQNPGQWLWQHRRWKQEGYNIIYEHYKADSILIVLPEDRDCFDWINQDLWIFEQVYRKSFLTFLVPEKFKTHFSLKNKEVYFYGNNASPYLKDYRFQLIYDFKDDRHLKKHYLSLGAHSYFNLNHFQTPQSSALHKSFENSFYDKVCHGGAVLKKPL